MKKDTKRDIPRRCLRYIRGKSIARTAIYTALAVAAVLTLSIATPAEDEAAPVPEPTYTPYYMTAEYQEAKRQEAEEAKAEADRIRKSIEDYQKAQEEKAEAEFKEMTEELAYPFNTMSTDWGAGDLEGFTYLDIPKEYKRDGGYFPKIVQIYIWKTCQDYGFDYATARAIVETETGYQYDEVGAANDTGYFQVVPKWHTDRMARLGAPDMLNPYQNTRVAIDYLAELLDKYDGNYAKALTAYNCGCQGAYSHYFSAGVDANPYARKVLEKAERIRKQLKKKEQANG